MLVEAIFVAASSKLSLVNWAGEAEDIIVEKQKRNNGFIFSKHSLGI